MNAAIRAVVQTASTRHEGKGIMRGYWTLQERDCDMDGTAWQIRFTVAVRSYTQPAVRNMTEEGQKRGAEIQAASTTLTTVVIGGDGSYRGAGNRAGINTAPHDRSGYCLHRLYDGFEHRDQHGDGGSTIR